MRYMNAMAQSNVDIAAYDMKVCEPALYTNAPLCQLSRKQAKPNHIQVVSANTSCRHHAHHLQLNSCIFRMREKTQLPFLEPFSVDISASMYGEGLETMRYVQPFTPRVIVGK